MPLSLPLTYAFPGPLQRYLQKLNAFHRERVQGSQPLFQTLSELQPSMRVMLPSLWVCLITDYLLI